MFQTAFLGMPQTDAAIAGFMYFASVRPFKCKCLIKVQAGLISSTIETDSYCRIF